jgi:hypothetical protein
MLERKPRRVTKSSRATTGLCIVAALLLPLGGCSDAPEEGEGLTGNAGNAGRPPTIVDPNASGATGGTSGGGSTDPGVCGETALNGCVGVFFEGESAPLDIYIMFDQSGSMLNDVGGMTRLEAVQRATTDFLRDEASRGIGVGIGYFGYLPIGETSCESSLYRDPDVAVSLDHEGVIASLGSRMPTGETPTAAAIEGGCEYAAAWKDDNPGRSVVMLLVTDGKPEAPVSCGNGGCCPTIDAAETAALACFEGKPSIATYVLGVGPELDLLNRIADAGGTRQAYLVGDDDVQANVLAALNGIRGDAVIPCKLEIPPPPSGDSLDYDAVNLFTAANDCNYETIFHVDERGACGDEGGWYYDDNAAPHTVELCPTSCDQVSRPGSRLRFSVGCATVGPPVR